MTHVFVWTLQDVVGVAVLAIAGTAFAIGLAVEWWKSKK